MYLKLIETENDTDAMLAYVRQNPASVEQYADKLANRFRHEVTEIYKTFIHSAANTASNRQSYWEVCQKIKKFRQIAGKKAQDEMIDAFMHEYQRRPAFVDELSKIK